MNTIKTEISIDFNENRSLKVVRLKQNDTALRHIVVALSHNGVAVQLDSSEETAKVSVSVGGVAVVVENSCTVYDNKVEFDVTSQMTALAGEGICDIKITKNNFTIYTASFKLLIEPSAVSADTPEIVPTTDFVKNFSAQATVDWTAYLLSAFKSMYPEYEETTKTWEVEDDYEPGETPSYFISTSDFTADSDGLFIIVRNNLLLRSWYTFDFTHPGATRIYINPTYVPLSEGDIVTFKIYKKPASGGGGVSGSAYVALSSLTTDSISGTATQEQEGE